MSVQLAFDRLLADADEHDRLARDRHRARVQALFDELSVAHKELLGEWMAVHEFDTCLALSAAACDWYRTAPAVNGR